MNKNLVRFVAVVGVSSLVVDPTLAAVICLPARINQRHPIAVFSQQALTLPDLQHSPVLEGSGRTKAAVMRFQASGHQPDPYLIVDVTSRGGLPQLTSSRERHPSDLILSVRKKRLQPLKRRRRELLESVRERLALLEYQRAGYAGRFPIDDVWAIAFGRWVGDSMDYFESMQKHILASGDFSGDQRSHLDLAFRKIIIVFAFIRGFVSNWSLSQGPELQKHLEIYVKEGLRTLDSSLVRSIRYPSGQEPPPTPSHEVASSPAETAPPTSDSLSGIVELFQQAVHSPDKAHVLQTLFQGDRAMPIGQVILDLILQPEVAWLYISPGMRERLFLTDSHSVRELGIHTLNKLAATDPLSGKALSRIGEILSTRGFEALGMAVPIVALSFRDIPRGIAAFGLALVAASLFTVVSAYAVHWLHRRLRGRPADALQPAALDSDDSRMAAIEMTGPDEQIPVLGTRIGMTGEEVQATAPDQRINELIAQLKDPNPEKRLTAVKALGELTDPRAVEALAAVFIKDEEDMPVEPSAGVRSEAVEALWRSLNRLPPENWLRQRIPPLLRVVRASDSDGQVRLRATGALRRMTWSTDIQGDPAAGAGKPASPSKTDYQVEQDIRNATARTARLIKHGQRQREYFKEAEQELLNALSEGLRTKTALIFAAYTTLGNLYRHQGDYPKAVETFRDALERLRLERMTPTLNPVSLRFVDLVRAECFIRFNLAETLRRMQEKEQALAVLSPDEGGTLMPALAADARSRSLAGEILLDLGRWHKAIAMIKADDQLALHPELRHNPQNYFRFATALKQVGRLWEIIILSDTESASVNPDLQGEVHAHMTLACLFIMDGHIPSAITVLRGARERFPHDPDVANLLESTLREQNGTGRGRRELFGDHGRWPEAADDRSKRRDAPRSSKGTPETTKDAPDLSDAVFLKAAEQRAPEGLFDTPRRPLAFSVYDENADPEIKVGLVVKLYPKSIRVEDRRYGVLVVLDAQKNTLLASASIRIKKSPFGTWELYYPSIDAEQRGGGFMERGIKLSLMSGRLSRWVSTAYPSEAAKAMYRRMALDPDLLVTEVNGKFVVVAAASDGLKSAEKALGTASRKLRRVKLLSQAA